MGSVSTTPTRPSLHSSKTSTAGEVSVGDLGSGRPALSLDGTRQPTKTRASMDLPLIWDAFGPSFTHEMLEKNVYGSNIEYGGDHPDVDNVVFVHGTIDPWHAMGVLEDISAEAPAIFINGTSHCNDT